jgi:hypothetical protein
MRIQDRIQEVSEEFKNREDALAIIRVHYNCETASIDDEGDVWIRGPQLGHWLGDEELEDVLWMLENALKSR